MFRGLVGTAIGAAVSSRAGLVSGGIQIMMYDSTIREGIDVDCVPAPEDVAGWNEGQTIPGVRMLRKID